MVGVKRVSKNGMASQKAEDAIKCKRGIRVVGGDVGCDL